MDVGSIVTRKIGPLPVWAYGAIVAALAWGYYYLSGKSLSVPDAGLPDTNASDADFPDVSTDSLGDGQGGNNTTPTPTAPSNNQSWFQLASNYLLGFNYEGLSVGNALTKYLTGESLTTSERALVNIAVSRYGAPPEGVPVSPGGNPTTPTLPTTPGGSGRGGTPVPRRGPWRLPIPVPRPPTHPTTPRR
jgi:hypothetical protein